MTILWLLIGVGAAILIAAILIIIAGLRTKKEEDLAVERFKKLVQLAGAQGYLQIQEERATSRGLDDQNRLKVHIRPLSWQSRAVFAALASLEVNNQPVEIEPISDIPHEALILIALRR